MAHYYPNVEGTGNRPLLLYFPLVLADIGCCCSNLLSAMNLDRTIWGPSNSGGPVRCSSRTWPSTGLHTLTTCYKDPSSNGGGSWLLRHSSCLPFSSILAPGFLLDSSSATPLPYIAISCTIVFVDSCSSSSLRMLCLYIFIILFWRGQRWASCQPEQYIIRCGKHKLYQQLLAQHNIRGSNDYTRRLQGRCNK